ncbi:hypothetical protein [Campylobacter concisus]|nr:hypothetical protein [Campylobacter concisus]
MKSFILNLEKEFSLIENGFKKQENRALVTIKQRELSTVKSLHS